MNKVNKDLVLRASCNQFKYVILLNNISIWADGGNKVSGAVVLYMGTECL